MKTAGSILSIVALPNPVGAPPRETTPIHVAIMDLLLKVIGWKCWCTATTRVFSDSQGYYIRCLECGRRLPYSGMIVAGFASLETRVGQTAD